MAVTASPALDIVERLREPKQLNVAHGGFGSGGMSYRDETSFDYECPLCSEAADIILSLRKELEEARGKARDELLAELAQPSEAMLAAALPLAGEPSFDDKRLGARACMLLSGSLNIPNEGDAVVAAAQLAADFRAMIGAFGGRNRASGQAKFRDLG